MVLDEKGAVVDVRAASLRLRASEESEPHVCSFQAGTLSAPPSCPSKRPHPKRSAGLRGSSHVSSAPCGWAMPRSSSSRCPFVNRVRPSRKRSSVGGGARTASSPMMPAPSFDTHTTSRRLDASASTAANARRWSGTHVAEHRRMEDHELGVVGRLGEQGRQILDQVARPDGGTLSPRQFDRPFEPAAALVMIRPHARHEPPDRILVAHVHRMEIQSPPPDDLRNRRGHWNWTRERAPQVNGRRGLAERPRLELVVELVEQQAEAGAGPDLDERQWARRQGRKQHGTAPDLVGLRSPGPHHVADLAAAPSQELPQLGARARHVVAPGQKLDGRKEEIGLSHGHPRQKAHHAVILGDGERELVVSLGVPPALPVGKRPIPELDSRGVVHSFRNRTCWTAWSGPFFKIRCARPRVGRMFSSRFGSLISRQMRVATASASSLLRSA